MRRSAPPWDATDANTSGSTTVGRSCWKNTSASSRSSETPDRRLLVVEGGSWREWTGERPPRAFVVRSFASGRLAVGGSLPPRTDVVSLDHLVERRRLDVEQLGRAFLY